MIEEIERTGVFKRGYKALKKKHYDMSKIDTVLALIVAGENEILIRDYDLHPLTGNKQGILDVHIEDNWLLLYVVSQDTVKLLLLATGSHDDVLGKANKYTLPDEYK